MQPQKRPPRGGFAIGMILLVIVLIAALTTYISMTATSTGTTAEISRIDVMTFRSASNSLARAIQRVADTCPKLTGNVNCDRQIRPALRNATPCENGAVTMRQVCPYDGLYGGALRVALPSKLFTVANPQWDIAYDVVAGGSATGKISMVLFINGLSKAACLEIEKTVLGSANATVPEAFGGGFSSSSVGQSLPAARPEACYSYTNFAMRRYDDEIIGRERNPYLHLAGISFPGNDENHTTVPGTGPDIGPSGSRYQYYVIIPTANN